MRALRWQLGAVLPESVAEKLSAAERDCFKAYDKLLGEYMGTGQDGVGIDLTVVSRPARETQQRGLAGTRLEERTWKVPRKSISNPEKPSVPESCPVLLFTHLRTLLVADEASRIQGFE